jgi:hypothetical protein
MAKFVNNTLWVISFFFSKFTKKHVSRSFRKYLLMYPDSKIPFHLLTQRRWRSQKLRLNVSNFFRSMKTKFEERHVNHSYERRRQSFWAVVLAKVSCFLGRQGEFDWTWWRVDGCLLCYISWSRRVDEMWTRIRTIFCARVWLYTIAKFQCSNFRQRFWIGAERQWSSSFLSDMTRLVRFTTTKNCNYSIVFSCSFARVLSLAD